jgi:hypothetical protein
MNRRCDKETGVMRILAGVLALAAFVALSSVASAQANRSNRPAICTLDYNPVCAVRNGSARTYSNACVARASGARIVAMGPCRPSPRYPVRSRG